MNTNGKWFDSVDIDTISEFPVSAYFVETGSKVKGDWSFQKWLESIDKDTLSMMEQYMNNFDDRYTLKEEEWEDFMAFAALALGREGAFDSNDEEDFMFNVIEENIPCIFGMIVMEGLRRKGAVEVKGNGLLLNSTVKYSLTKKGLQIQEELKKETASKNNVVIDEMLSTLFIDQKN